MYDSACLDLALSFLDDTAIEEEFKEDRAKELAQRIQTTIEDYLKELHL